VQVNYVAVPQSHPVGCIAGNNNLIRTGGSDFHGFQKDFSFLGKSRVPQFCVRELKELKGTK